MDPFPKAPCIVIVTVYMGLKEATISLLCGLCRYCKGAWSLRVWEVKVLGTQGVGSPEA